MRYDCSENRDRISDRTVNVGSIFGQILCNNDSERIPTSRKMREKWGSGSEKIRQKVKKSNISPIAGEFSGTYGLALVATGLGKLSRLRVVTGARFQLRSMNFRIET